ncbi:hypothetical protein Tco_0849614 [Tanacetum coccineum]
MPTPNLIDSNSPTVSPFLKDCIVYIPYTNAKTFVNDVLSNLVGYKELKLIDSVGTRRMKKKEIKKDENAGNGKEDAWSRIRLYLHAYASFCVAFYHMKFDRDFFHPGSLVSLISIFSSFEVYFITLRTMLNLSVRE